MTSLLIKDLISLLFIDFNKYFYTVMILIIILLLLFDVSLISFLEIRIKDRLTKLIFRIEKLKSNYEVYLTIYVLIRYLRILLDFFNNYILKCTLIDYHEETVGLCTCVLCKNCASLF